MVELEVFPRAFFPGPLDVVRGFAALVYKGIFPVYLQDSLTRLAVGAAAGVAVGVPFGLLVGLHPASYRFFWPLIIFFQAIGDIAWLPILLIWFGFTLTTMTFVIVYTVIFPVIFNAAMGVRTIPVDMIHAARSLGAPPSRIVWEVIIPGALPNIITGLRNGLGYGWRALIAAEIIIGTSGIGFMMFDARRSFALFPWKTVLDNIGFGLKMRGVPKAQRDRIAREYVSLVGIDGFEHRYPHELSGGMRQRVGVARVLANEPEVMLMDEPFASVDAQTRMTLQEELTRIWEAKRPTILFVTHDVEEAVFLANRVVVLNPRPGRVREIVNVQLPRPRAWSSLVEDPGYRGLVARILSLVRGSSG